ncbi:hypothetical protein ABIC03_002206 [Bradyrhizobium sp. RT6a]
MAKAKQKKASRLTIRRIITRRRNAAKRLCSRGEGAWADW